MAASMICLLGEKWFESYTKFRSNPSSFLSSSERADDVIYLDMLKDLCSEEIDNECKIHILLLIQDNASILIPSVEKVEQTVGSLKALFQSLHQVSDRTFKCQLLVTIVTVLLSHEQLEETNSSLFTLLTEVKDLLIGIIANKQRRDPILCATVCKCLEEIEQFFPGVLHPYMEDILVACKHETSAIFQCYVSLLSLIINHVTQTKAADFENKCSEKQSTTTVGKKMLYRTLSCETEILPSVIFMMDLIPLMSTMTCYHVMKRLVQIVSDTPDLLPVTFKMWIPKLMFISNIPLFHLSFSMHKAFGSDLFTNQEEQMLLRQLILRSCHPALSTTHRLLYMDWINSCLNKKEQKSPRWTLLPEQVSLFLLGPFDGPDTQEKKLKLLATFLPYSQASNILMPALEGMKKYIAVNQSIRGSSSLFRTLFCYINLHNNIQMKEKIHRFMLDLVENSPDLTHHVLDFLQCVMRQNPSSEFPDEVMLSLVEMIVNLPLVLVEKNLESYLLILEKSLLKRPEVCKPNIILQFLKKLLENTNICQNGNWLLGNAILFVCCSILQHQNIDLLYAGLGEVLYLLMMNYEDIDVKVQAKLYYSALTLLSSSKVKKLFQKDEQLTTPISCISTLVTSSSTFHVAHPIQHLQKPILKLVRIFSDTSTTINKIFIESDSFEFTEEHMQQYRQYLTHDFMAKVLVPVDIQFMEEVTEKFHVLYGVVIKVQSVPPCGGIKSIEIPFISQRQKKMKAEDNTIYLELAPESPRPVELKFKAEFTCKDGRSFQCDIPHIEIQFEDLFLSLPVPTFLNDLSPDLWKRKLFDNLWSAIEKEADKGFQSSSCQQSVHKLHVTREQFNLIIEQWRMFVIPKIEEIVTVCDVGMLLPKNYHLLMKIEMLNDVPIIRISTDHWSLLPLLGVYFRKLESLRC